MSYASDIDKFRNNVLTNIYKTVRGVGCEMQDRLVERTPIDTGRAKSSWNIVEGEEPNLDVTPVLKDQFSVGFGAGFVKQGRVTGQAAQGSSPLTADQAAAVAKNQQNEIPFLTTPIVTVSNNLDYIESLENGHSRQAPQGMFAITVAEFKPIVDQVVATL